jgi:hypothetical protein
MDNGGSSSILNIYSSRGKLFEISNNSFNSKGSPNSKEIERVLDGMLKDFSFYSEPVEEREV